MMSLLALRMRILDRDLLDSFRGVACGINLSSLDNLRCAAALLPPDIYDTNLLYEVVII